MKHYILFYLIVAFITISCSKDTMIFDENQDKIETFTEFWNFVDEHYIFFDQKEVNWDDIKTKYIAQIDINTTEEQLFDICEDALHELKDAHNRIESEFKKSTNYDITKGFEVHFSHEVIRDNYLGGQWEKSGNIYYQIVDDVGYIYIFRMSQYGGFVKIVKEMKEKGVKGLIVDIRNNPGGDSDPIPSIISNFISKPTSLGYYVEKSGPDHQDVTDPIEVVSQPSIDFNFGLPIALLINRKSYSASTYMASMFKEIENTTIIGQVTGGGAGGNYGYQLSNGWIVAVSVSDFLNSDLESVESGVTPDIEIENSISDIEAGRDMMLEFAIKHILEK